MAAAAVKGGEQSGMTMLEVLIVMALIVIMIAVSLKSIQGYSASSDMNKFSSDVAQITYGISEYRLISKKIPLGASWPATLNDFVDANLRAKYAYSCDASTSSKVTITTTSKFSADPMQKFFDQRLCTSTGSSYNSVAQTVTCRLDVLNMENCL